MKEYTVTNYIDTAMDAEDARRMVDIWFDQVTPALNKANDLAGQVACCLDEYTAGGAQWLEDNKQEFVRALNNARAIMYEIDNDELIDEIDRLNLRIKQHQEQLDQLGRAAA